MQEVKSPLLIQLCIRNTFATLVSSLVDIKQLKVIEEIPNYRSFVGGQSRSSCLQSLHMVKKSAHVQKKSWHIYGKNTCMGRRTSIGCIGCMPSVDPLTSIIRVWFIILILFYFNNHNHPGIYLLKIHLILFCAIIRNEDQHLTLSVENFKAT